MARPDTTQLRNLLDPAREVTIFLPQNPHYDLVAAGLGLKLTLESSGKSVSVICPNPMTVEFNRLVGVESIASSFGGHHLIIAFPGQTEYVDKVSYNLDHGELQLVISPKPGSPALDHKKLKVIPGASSADLFLLVGVHDLAELGDLYKSAHDQLSTIKLVAFTQSPPRQSYTPHQIFDPEASSLSELVAQLIDALGLNFHPDAASNLLSGLKIATDHFSSPRVSPATFETAALLVRRGAKSQPDAISAESYPTGSIPTSTGWGTDSQPPQETTDTPSPTEPPAEWFGPKVYRGPMLP